MSSRKPAPIVSCQYCNWKGSARGLFTHVRLSHPGIEKKPPTSTNVHPLDTSKKSINTVKKRRRASVGSDIEADITNASLWALGIAVFLKILNNLPDKERRILQREGINPNFVKSLGGFD